MTVRPSAGLTNVTLSALEDWCRKVGYYALYVEKEYDPAQRHAHLQIWHEPKHRGDVNKALERICARTIEHWDTQQARILRQGTRYAYNDWYAVYCEENLDKKDTPEESLLISQNIPQDTDPYYPTPEEQAERQVLTTASDPRFAKMEIDLHKWLEEHPLYSIRDIKTIRRFIACSMFNTRTMQVKILKRDRIALADTLWCYVNRTDSHLACAPLHEPYIEVAYDMDPPPDTPTENIILD